MDNTAYGPSSDWDAIDDAASHTKWISASDDLSWNPCDLSCSPYDLSWSSYDLSWDASDLSSNLTRDASDLTWDASDLTGKNARGCTTDSGKRGVADGTASRLCDLTRIRGYLRIWSG